MRIVLALAAIVCGFAGVVTTALAMRTGVLGFDPRSAALLAFAASALYLSWRAGRRALRRPSPTASVAPRMSLRRFGASLALAIVLMVGTFLAAFILADSGDYGGDSGILAQSLMLLGHGIRFVFRIPRDGSALAAAAEIGQCALLTVIFYALGTWWAARRAGA
jgi:hypothetical protein